MKIKLITIELFGVTVRFELDYKVLSVYIDELIPFTKFNINDEEKRDCSFDESVWELSDAIVERAFKTSNHLDGDIERESCDVHDMLLEWIA